jgi:hypothetical protein
MILQIKLHRSFAGSKRSAARPNRADGRAPDMASVDQSRRFVRMRSGAADQVSRASARPSTVLTRTRASTSDNIGLLARGPNWGGVFSPREPKSLMPAPSRRRNGALPKRRHASSWHLDGSLDAGNNGVASKCTIRRRRTIRAAQSTGVGDYPGAREVFGRASGGGARDRGARSDVEAFGNHPLPAHTLLTISQLAWPGMIVEIDVTAIVPLK